MAKLALALTVLGSGFAALAAIYGYFFGVFWELVAFVAGKPVIVSKAGELFLFTFLALVLPLLAIPFAILSRNHALVSRRSPH